jgi:hypothetical protein
MLRLITYVVSITLSGALIGLSLITPVVFSPYIASLAIHSCPLILANVDFQGLDFVVSVGPPLYSWPQFVLKPGSTATLMVTYESRPGLRLHFEHSTGSLPSYVIYWGTIGNDTIRAWNQTGLQISDSSIVYPDNSTARLTYEVSSNSSSPQGTHMLSWSSTCYGDNNSPWILLTVGSQTYNGVLPFGQGMEKLSFATVLARELDSFSVSREFFLAGILTLIAIPAIWIFDFLYEGFRKLRK